jgi:hypothetical protein
MYDPGVGRWLEQDPVGFAAGDSNLYRYVNNNSTNEVDPSGLVSGTRHHAYPLFLGGSNDQPVFVLDSVEAHQAAHNYLARYGLRTQNPAEAQQIWRGLSQARRREIIIGSLEAAGVPRRIIDRYIGRVMADATPGEAVARVAGYPGGLISASRRLGRRGSIAAGELIFAVGQLGRLLGRVAASPEAMAIEEILLNPTEIAGPATLYYERSMAPPSSPDLYWLPRGTIILPNGQIYILLPEDEFGPSDFEPPPGSLVVIQSERIHGQDVRPGSTSYPQGSVAPATSLPWILSIPENVTEEQARRDYVDYLNHERFGQTMTFERWARIAYQPWRTPLTPDGFNPGMPPR